MKAQLHTDWFRMVHISKKQLLAMDPCPWYYPLTIE